MDWSILLNLLSTSSSHQPQSRWSFLTYVPPLVKKSKEFPSQSYPQASLAQQLDREKHAPGGRIGVTQTSPQEPIPQHNAIYIKLDDLLTKVTSLTLENQVLNRKLDEVIPSHCTSTTLSCYLRYEHDRRFPLHSQSSLIFIWKSSSQDYCRQQTQHRQRLR